MSNWEGIAGVQVGMKANQVMLYDKFTREKKTLTMQGHRLYVVKCKRNDAGPIVVPDKSKQICTFVLILARGEGCSMDMQELAPMMKVSVPDEHLGICRSPYNENEYIIDENIVQLASQEEPPNDETGS